MIFTSAIQKLRLVFPCCNKRKGRQSVEIGGPTDVRRVDISDSLLGLTDAQRKHIREKASSDAARLLSLHSYPPIITTSPIISNTPTPTPTTLPNPNHLGPQPENTFTMQPSVISPYEPSTPTTLLNAASKNEPSNVPTPPRLLHNEDDVPAIRTKSMWKSDKRYSSDFGGHADILYETLPGVREVNERNSDEPSKALDFEFDWGKKESGSDAAHKLGSIGASEIQDSADREQELNNAASKQHA